MFIENAWYVGAWPEELQFGNLLSRRILGQQILFYRQADGTATALIDECCHRKAPLSVGVQEADNVRCMYHGLVFAPDGRCVEIPGQDVISPRIRVRSYPVVEQDGYIWIWMGEPERAKTEDIIPRPWQASSEWAWKPGYVHVGADYRLIMDNLLDFSHLSFVHQNSFGGSRSMANTQAKIERIDGGIRIKRQYPSDPVPPYISRLAPTLEGPVDRWQTYEWRTLGNLLDLDSGFAPAGKGALDGVDVPGALRFHSIQSLTPETETSTHYFWSYTRNFDLDNEALSDKILDETYAGLEEDKVMIEAQQQVVLRTGDHDLMALSMDAGVVQGRNMLKRALAEDRGAAAA
ncbi:Toluene-4-sulfonate monooxygenase system iron-sulfur subunit TsaM1 [uncultured Sphingopyxis sp.]|uniref:Toluene-4-sulfonate monooxygenase system iron-sulfur subunit TsaM1 n=1 Tax=uncultured Sphingopyxis sp. TaxID=310581 RepID=A0A1Y5PP45_9SPHN|nr:aromatic ring-hydroxylating dioxygenase subunit alpha [uncultured Sphingopyxis sp.]SBV31789.1 Toluene-4-sulfonate monooxygenase system iron-sulfur subunit TsaM1 [uncultured Sphingopyxis sp.]